MACMVSATLSLCRQERLGPVDFRVSTVFNAEGWGGGHGHAEHTTAKATSVRLARSSISHLGVCVGGCWARHLLDHSHPLDLSQTQNRNSLASHSSASHYIHVILFHFPNSLFYNM